MELKKAKITSYEEANRYFEQVFRPKFNKKFTIEPAEKETAFVKMVGVDIERIFSRRHERVVGKDNTISLYNHILRIPKYPGASLSRRKV